MKQNPVEDDLVEQASLYALGTLSEDESRAFEQHLAEGCDSCSAELADYRAIAERLALGVLREEPPVSIRQSLVESLGGEERIERPAPSPEVMQTQLTIRANEGEWIEMTKGVFAKQLFADKSRGTVTTLYRLLPGARLPDHRHTGVEECLVLEGDFRVDGETFGPGDYRCAPPGTIDRELYTEGGVLFLLVAAETCEFLEPVSR
ncbi:MAG: cupin domain-containing protein [Blastocatellia bacterium]|nr:cupin domain-containing protein [Blastocatellia bacterium]